MTSDEDRTIRHAEKKDSGQVAVLMADALAGTPVGAWLISDPAVRTDLFRRYFHRLADQLYTDMATILHVTGGPTPTGCAWWLDVVTYELDPPLDRNNVFDEVFGPYADRFRLLDTIARRTLVECGLGESWLLALVAVDRSRHRTGIGSTLMRHTLSDMDTHGAHWPTWAVALSPTHRMFLERHGFTVTADTFLPDNGPTLWPMFRPGPKGVRPVPASGRCTPA
ncbi:GNAT family N-acetyltransferase [Phytohabitans sp. LJ34]|uniref:GNAT family N-acetyltransferase n=1 Tax=Phytohabitans sp. LJ34 TaxID=3452217 RepID=UPI003F88AE6B